MADHSKPNTGGTDPYSQVLSLIKDRFDDMCKMFRGVTATNLPVGTVRFNDTGFKFEKWSGTAWEDLAATYGINVDKVDGKDASTTATAGTIPVRDANGKVPGAITGDAASVANKTPGTGAGNLVYLDIGGKIPVGQIPTISGGDADTVEGMELSLAKAAQTIPLRDDNGNIFSDVTGNVAGNTAGTHTGPVVGGSFGGNGGIYLNGVPGTYNWTAPPGVNKVFRVLWGAGGGGGGLYSHSSKASSATNGGAGGSSTFAAATAYGGNGGLKAFIMELTIPAIATGGAGGGTLGDAGNDGMPATNDLLGGDAVSGHIQFNKSFGKSGCGTRAYYGYGEVFVPKSAGSGGAGGMYADMVEVVPGQTYTITIGAGGIAGINNYQIEGGIEMRASSAGSNGGILLLY